MNCNKVYYKVIAEDKVHNGYEYKQGLNIDPVAFNDDPKESCCAGGFYFTDHKHILEFLGYGTHISRIKLPIDAKVVKDPEGNKWRADKIIVDFNVKKKDYKKCASNPINEYAISRAASNGHKEIVELLLANKAPIDEFAIYYAASNGHKEIVELLLANKAPINEWAICYAASNGHKEIVELLLANNAPIDESSICCAASKEIVELFEKHDKS